MHAMQMYTKNNILYKELSANHASQMHDVYRQSFATPWSKGFFHSIDHHYLTIGAFDSHANKLIGFIMANYVLNEAEIIAICVIKPYRNQAIGQSLLHNMIEYKKIKSLFLEVNEQNRQALHIYTKLGFKQINIRKNYYKIGNKLHNAIVYKYTKHDATSKI